MLGFFFVWGWLAQLTALAENTCEEVTGNCLYPDTCALLEEHGFVSLLGIPCGDVEHCQGRECVCCFNAGWSDDDDEDDSSSSSSSDVTSDALHRCWAMGGKCLDRSECEELPLHAVDDSVDCLRCHSLHKRGAGHNPMTEKSYASDCVCCVKDRITPSPTPAQSPSPTPEADCNITDMVEIVQKSTCELHRTEKGRFVFSTLTVLPRENLAVINNFDAYASGNIFERGSCDNRITVPIPLDDDDYLALFNESLPHNTNGWMKTLGEYISPIWPDKSFPSVAFSREFTLSEIFAECEDFEGNPLPDLVEEEDSDNFFYEGSMYTTVVTPEDNITAREDFIFFQKECMFHITVSGRKGTVSITYFSILVDFEVEWEKTVCDDKRNPFYVLSTCTNGDFSLVNPRIVNTTSPDNSTLLLEGYGAEMDGAQLVPPNNTATATADLTLFVNERDFTCFWLTWTDIDPEYLLIYEGEEGENGELLDMVELDTNGTEFDACVDPVANITSLIRAGQVYVTLDDKIRGHLLPVQPPCSFDDDECCTSETCCTQLWLMYNGDNGSLAESIEIDWSLEEGSGGSLTAFIDMDVSEPPCFELLESEHNFTVECDLFHDEAFTVPYTPEEDFFVLCNDVFVNCSITSFDREEYCDFFDLDVTAVILCTADSDGTACAGEEIVLYQNGTTPHNPPFDFDFVAYEDCCLEERFGFLAKWFPGLGDHVLVSIEYCINSKTHQVLAKRTPHFLFANVEDHLFLPHKTTVCQN